MSYRKGDEIRFRNGTETLTGWVESDEPVYDRGGNIIGYSVSCPQFQGIVRAANVVPSDVTQTDAHEPGGTAE